MSKFISKAVRNNLDALALNVLFYYYADFQFKGLAEKSIKSFKAHKLVRQAVGAADGMKELDLNEDQTKGAATNVLLRLVKRGLIVKQKGNGKRFIYVPNPKLIPINMASITEETAPVLLEDYSERVLKSTMAEAKSTYPLDVVKQALFVANAVNANAGSKYAVELAEGAKVNVNVALEDIRQTKNIMAAPTKRTTQKKPAVKKSPKKKKAAPAKHAKKSSASGLDDFW